MKEMSLDTTAGTAPLNASPLPRDSSSADYSQTNLQKLGVDEPELLKSNGNYLFYYVQKAW